MKQGDVVADRYELEELAGSGGMSNVYRAYDRMLERRVAIKVLHERYSSDEEYVERFRREARAIARLSHPNIVTVIDRGEWGGRQFIVFEYVAGETLKERIARQGSLPVREALTIVRDVARGLAFAHEHGVVHRDVKPHNVLIDSEGTPKVTDFGIARSLDRDDGLTMTGTLLGTSDYLAPEQAAGELVSERTDQYSLGVLLYELLTGDVPYPSETLVTAAMRHMKDPVPSVRDSRPDVSPEVDDLVARAMQKRPEDRFASTAAFVTALEACLARYEEDTLSDWTPPRETRQPSRRVERGRRRVSPLVAVLAAVAFAAALIVAAVLALRETGTDVPGIGGSSKDTGTGPTAAAVRLSAVRDYDPDGDGTEHPEDVPAATDGNPSTYWTTETYSSFDKPGVGIVLRTSQPVDDGTLVLRSDTPGFTAEIRAGDAAGGPFVTVSEEKTAGARTAFQLDTSGDDYRFLLVWITDPNGRAHVNEVTLR
jgi:serine/threonine-protein kinase